VFGQLLRSLVSSKHTSEAFFLAPMVVYLTELFRSVEQ
jgi:hypothetical protein